jgi:hypothetical protein
MTALLTPFALSRLALAEAFALAIVLARSLPFGSSRRLQRTSGLAPA